MESQILHKIIEEDGNDCTIHKAVTMFQLGYKWIVTITTRAHGSWVDESINCEHEAFDDKRDAEAYYDDIGY